MEFGAWSKSAGRKATQKSNMEELKARSGYSQHGSLRSRARKRNGREEMKDPVNPVNPVKKSYGK
jgi:hypothetical protein